MKDDLNTLNSEVDETLEKLKKDIKDLISNIPAMVWLLTKTDIESEDFKNNLTYLKKIIQSVEREISIFEQFLEIKSKIQNLLKQSTREKD